jgi:hypothetical protein
MSWGERMEGKGKRSMDGEKEWWVGDGEERIGWRRMSWGKRMEGRGWRRLDRDGAEWVGK